MNESPMSPLGPDPRSDAGARPAPPWTRTMDDREPERLVAAMAAGEEGALERLYDLFSGAVFSVASGILGNDDDASEVTLDAFTHAWIRAADFDGGRGSVATWLTVLTRSRALDRVRARRSRRARVEKAAAREGGRPAMGSGPRPVDGLVETRERRGHLHTALKGLSEAQRRAIELAFYEGLSHTQIARRLEVPLGTIKTRIRTGLRRLREILGPSYSGEWS